MRRPVVSLCSGLVALAFGVSSASAATGRVPPGGGLDPRYGSGGSTVSALSATAGDRFFTAAEWRGLSYAAGFVTTGTDQAMAVARYRHDGHLDRSFGGDGFTTVNVAPGRGSLEAARGIGVQSSGKVVVAGPAESITPGTDARDADIYVARFTLRGTLDPTFGTGGILRLDLSPGAVTNPTTGSYRTDLGYGVVVLPDDKVVVIGTRGPGGTPGRLDRDFAFIGLTPNGALDPTFGDGGGGITFLNTRGVVNGVEQDLNESARQAIVAPDGKIVVGSYSEGTDGSAVPRLIRLLPNGSLDPAFGVAGIATAPLFGTAANETEFYDVALQGHNYVVTGYGRPGLAGTVDMFAARFRPDGSWDRTFGDNGLVRVDLAGHDDRGRDLVVFPDGRVLLVGSGKPTATNLDAMAVMLTPGGRLDTTFDSDGILLVDFGGPADSFFGAALTVDRKRAFLAGYKGASPASGDDAAVARVWQSLPPMGPTGGEGFAGWRWRYPGG